MNKIEIPFGAYDSETLGWTYTIPKGYTAKIEDGKIIVKKEETKDKRIRKSLIYYLHGLGEFDYPDKETYNNCLAYLEKQKEQMMKEAVEGTVHNFSSNKPHPTVLVDAKGFNQGDKVRVSS